MCCSWLIVMLLLMVVVSDVDVKNNDDDEEEMVKLDGISPPWTYSHCRCCWHCIYCCCCCDGNTACTNSFRAIFFSQFIFSLFRMKSMMWKEERKWCNKSVGFLLLLCFCFPRREEAVYMLSHIYICFLK